jgi:hypothetical protein
MTAGLYQGLGSAIGGIGGGGIGNTTNNYKTP